MLLVAVESGIIVKAGAPNRPSRIARGILLEGVAFIILVVLGTLFIANLTDRALSGLLGLLGRPIFLFWSLLLAIWFLAVLIPYEESELASLFGDEYRDYRRQMPVLFPYGRRYRRSVCA